jgi:hypothetical protein
MEGIQEFFYWTASIALIIISLFIIVLIGFVFYMRRLAGRGMQRLDEGMAHFQNAAHTWRNLTVTRFVIKTLRTIF